MGKFKELADIRIDEKKNQVVGTPYYIAPELILEQEPSAQSDFWAVGICLYEFVYGVKPFEDDAGNVEALFQRILQEEVQFPEDDSVSESCVDLMRKLLCKNPR